MAAPQATSSPLAGTLLLEDGEQLANALADGDWIAGGLAAFSTVMDAVAVAADPLGQLIAMGLGWVLEHLEPLKGWLKKLTGDPDAVAGFAQTWANIDRWLSGLADDLRTMTAKDLAGMSGVMIDAYTAYQADLAALIGAAGRWTSGMATALGLASMLVQIVHDIVRDAIAEVAGAVCAYAVELAFTVGLATPLVVAQATARTAAVTTRVSRSVADLIDSGTQLAKHSDELADLFRKAGNLLENGKPRTRHARPEPLEVPPARPTQAPSSARVSADGSNPFLVHQTPIEYPVPTSKASLQAVNNRGAQAAARVDRLADRSELLAELKRRGIKIDPRTLKKADIDCVIRQLKRRTSDPEVEDLLDSLKAAAHDERTSLTDLKDASEAMGTAAGKDLIATQGFELVKELDSTKPGKNTFDQVATTRDLETTGHGRILVVENKGGAAELSPTGRKVSDVNAPGGRAPQGSPAYFADLWNKNKPLQSWLAANPKIAEGLQKGTITIDYALAKVDAAGIRSFADLALTHDIMSRLKIPQPE